MFLNTAYIPTALQSFFELRRNNNSSAQQALNMIAFMDQLDAYYENNGLYQGAEAADYMLANWAEAMVGLRTVANRVVEFYVSKLEPGSLPGALPIITKNSRIIDPLQQIYLWSNLAQNKAAIIRNYALYGDMFIKVVGETGKVYFQIFEPRYVTEFSTDNVGNITRIRIDQPTREDDRNMTYTEIWDKDGYKIYVHFGEIGSSNMLGTPRDSGALAELGIDFVPFVQAKFKDVGKPRGVGSFVHALDKIDEANRMASRLHQILFRYNKPLWVVSANSNDAYGRPLPAPHVGDSSDVLNVEDDTILSMPGMSDLKATIPAIDYAAALAILNSMMDELEKDLPELKHGNLKELQLSGVALRLLMSDAIDRVVEARGNFEGALTKAGAMALSIGSYQGLFGSIGNYANGDFAHSFKEREVIPLSELERATVLAQYTSSGFDLYSAMAMAGYSDEQIALVKKNAVPVGPGTNQGVADASSGLTAQKPQNSVKQTS
jgi:hypothetical protein